MTVTNTQFYIFLLFFEIYLFLNYKTWSDPLIVGAMVILIVEILISMKNHMQSFMNPAEVQKQVKGELPVFEITCGETKVDRSIDEATDLLKRVYGTNEEITVIGEREYWIPHNSSPETYRRLETIKEFFGATDVIVTSNLHYKKIKLKY